MTTATQIHAFNLLGKFLKSFPDEMGEYVIKENVIKLEEAIQQSCNLNPWFTRENILQALHSIGNSLEESKTEHWLFPYSNKLNLSKVQKTVALVMAGNIPLVGFHDFFCVLVSGHKALIKLSSNDNKLLPVLSQILINAEPSFVGQIEFTENKLAGFDAVIATGSNNSSRYFEYYFGKYPHIIRKNRNSVAILTGNETQEELNLLERDIFSYFGMGCRNVSHLFVPQDYSFDRFFESMTPFSTIANHNKYKNNYDYQKTIYMINIIPFLDNGFMLVKEYPGYSSPVSVLHYSSYKDIKEVVNQIQKDKEQIQCVVAHQNLVDGCIPFGKAQQPELWDYADGIDTMEFLLNL